MDSRDKLNDRLSRESLSELADELSIDGMKAVRGGINRKEDEPRVHGVECT